METKENSKVEVEKTETEENKVDSSKDAEITKLKEMLSKANSEAAGYKKQLKEKMSADERAETERLEYTQGLEEKIKKLEKDQKISSHKAKFMSLGFDEETATKQANALLDGNEEAFFSNMKVLIDSVGNNAVNNALKNQKGLTSGEPTTVKKTYTREEIAKMSPDEINKHWDEIKGNIK